MPLVEQILRHVSPEPNSGCWLWLGSVNKENGYALVSRVSGRTRLAHRLLYEELIGPIPKGLELDHLCRVPCCVNPKHLDPVTHAENMRRGSRAQAQTCKHGHPLSGKNLRVWQRNGRTMRVCIACNQKNVAKYKARKRAERAVNSPRHP